MENNKKKTIALIALILAGTFVVFWTKGRNIFPAKNNLSENTQTNTTNGNKTKNSGSVSAETSKLNCANGWQEYHQDVLGIAFCHPEEWGNPTVGSISNLTRLSDMEADFKRLNTYYENKLDINFKKNKQINIRLFSDQYSGKSQRNINEPYVYYESGSTAEIIKLKNGSSICDYQVGYDYKYNPKMQYDTLATVYDECADEIKTVLTQDKEVFEKTLFTYDLRLLSFKKINNGYFDNVLISYAIDQANQIQEEIKTLDEFFNSKKTTQVENGVPAKTKEQFSQEWNEFKKFVDTVAVFKPVLAKAAEFKQVLGEDPNITTIRKYYWLIESGKLDAAYVMYADKSGASLEEFRERYKDAYLAEPMDFKSLGENRYEFHVRYQDHNSEETEFQVTMEVSGNIVRTIFLEEYAGEVVKFGNMEAYSARRGDKNYVFLIQSGKEIIIDEGEAEYDDKYSNLGEVKFFGAPLFSQSGKYLVYTMSGWEWSVTYIYNTETKKEVARMSSWGGFTDEEQYAFGCSSPGMSSGDGKVFSLPEGKIEYDIYSDASNNKYENITCSYVEADGYVAFVLSGYHDGDKLIEAKKEIRFNLKDKKATEIK